MDTQSRTFVAIGALLLLALAGEWAARRLRLPRVTALLVIGILVGPSALDLLPPEQERWEPVVTSIALVMVGFLLGSDFDWRHIRSQGGELLGVATIAAAVTAVVVAGGLLVAGADLRVALALGGISAATAPAATVVVIRDVDAEGPLTSTLRGVVAIDDAIGLVLFSMLLAVGQVIAGGGEATGLLLESAREVGGAVVLGVALGLPAALLTGRLRPGEPTLMEALAVVLLVVGIGMWLEVSFLLASVVAGAVVANVASHHKRPFRAIERVEWPFLALFFILSGAALELGGLIEHGVLIAAYVVLRTAGRYAGGFVGAMAMSSGATTRLWLGVTLLPQAGIALGLALLAGERFPDIAEVVVPVVVTSTVAFAIVGPVLTRVALERSGEARSH